MAKYVFQLCLLLISITAGNAAVLQSDSDPDWELARDKNEIKVYTRSIPGSKIKEFKAETKVKSSVSALLDILLDFNGYTHWVSDCVKSELLANDDLGKYKYYVEFSAPWPISNRDLVVEAMIIREKNGEVTFKMKGIPDYLEEREGCKRMPAFAGSWQFIPVEGGWVEVIHQVHAEPGGSVPAWLANARVTDGPLATIDHLREILDGK